MNARPMSTAAIAEESQKVLAEGGLFVTSPMTIRGVDYPVVFNLSSVSLRELLAVKATEFSDRECLVYGDTRLTVKQTWDQSMRFANWLMSAQGVKPGDRVGIAMRNYPEWCIAYIGIVATGATVVPLNAWWQAEELRVGLELAGAKIVVCDQKRFGHLEPLRKKLGLTLIAAREDVPDADVRMEDVLADETVPDDMPRHPIDPESDFSLLYTSGSTGRPKGVLLTHRSVNNAVLSWAFLLEVAQGLQPDMELVPENPASLLALPLFHVTASHTIFLLAFLTGRKLVFQYRWDSDAAIDLMVKEKITHFVGVPTMAHELVQNPRLGEVETLRDITVGGAKRPETQVKRQFEVAPHIIASAAYGLTETNSAISYVSLADYHTHSNTAGRAIPPINQIEAFAEDGTQLPRGAEGEICIKSPVTFRSYLDDEAATRAAYHDGGWFRSGDIGFVDDEGYVTIVDRSKDIIIRGGENVSCLEVENALLGVEGVDEAAVFSVSDEKMGERVGAVVYSRDNALDLPSIRDAVAQKLAPFKVPERMWISPQSLPRGTTGKVDKRQIKQIAITYAPHWSA